MPAGSRGAAARGHRGRRERHPDPGAAVRHRAGLRRGWSNRFRPRYAPIVVVSEGAHPKAQSEALVADQLDAFGHVRLGGVGQMLAAEIEQRTGKEARCAVLGHIQRGGTPTAFDRVLATRFGVHAISAVHDGAFGSMVALRGTDIVRVSLDEATREPKLVSPERYAEAGMFFG